ncbi:hypothetical protein TNCV_766241 [Trichonephila clavipes]|nr:hypothetical protein TNCV_766241 [Trichonephila clavipes]
MNSKVIFLYTTVWSSGHDSEFATEVIHVESLVRVLMLMKTCRVRKLKPMEFVEAQSILTLACPNRRYRELIQITISPVPIQRGHNVKNSANDAENSANNDISKCVLRDRL